MLSKLFELFFVYPPEAFRQAKLVFASRIPGEARLAILVGLGALVWFLYRKAATRTSTKVYRAVLVLRIAMIALLVFVLGAPTLRTYVPKKESLFTAILVDGSRSMSVADVDAGGAKASRIAAARELVYGDNGLVHALANDSQTIVYTFSDSARRASPKDLADAIGTTTNIFRSIHDMESELRGVPLASVVLVTDGCRNAGGTTNDAAAILKARGVPLFAVGVGDPRPPKDLEVVEVAAPRYVRRDSEVEVDVTVRHTGFDRPFKLNLKRGDALILTRAITPSKDTDLQRVRLLFTPDQEGTATYRVEIPADASGEQFTENNTRTFAIDTKDDRLPVLYIEGSPRLEYRFLRRALFRDRNFRLVGMLRLAPNRFYIQGANESEFYLAQGFPDTPERLAAFQAIILGDVEAGLFTPRQLELLEDFVKNRGGGLLMLGGVNSFGLGGYTNTPVGNMLPVAISPKDAAYNDEQFTAQPVHEKLSHIVMRLSLDPVENKTLWTNAPPLIGITPVAGVKPGATLLLSKPGTQNPVLAVQQYGQGRVGAFMSGGSWYWRVSKPSTDEFHERFWKQMVRWLVVGAKEQLAIGTDAEIYARLDPVTLRATVLGKDMKPLNDAIVSATFVDPAGNKQQISMDWILSQEGVYQCRYVPELEGQFNVIVTVKGWEGTGAGTTFMVAPPTAEFASTGMKEGTLQEMAAATGGKYFPISQSGSLPDEIRKSLRATAMMAADPIDKPIWNMPILFVVIVGLAGAEWLIRRKNGFA